MLNFIFKYKKKSVFSRFLNLTICGYVRECSCSSEINTEKFRGARSGILSNGSAKIVIVITNAIMMRVHMAK